MASVNEYDRNTSVSPMRYKDLCVQVPLRMFWKQSPKKCLPKGMYKDFRGRFLVILSNVKKIDSSFYFSWAVCIVCHAENADVKGGYCKVGSGSVYTFMSVICLLQC